ncbi:MAG: hypothetical protein ABI340_02710 [Nitrososphaera sp.]
MYDNHTKYPAERISGGFEMSILGKAFRLLPKSVQSTLLLEELKRVDAYLQYNRGMVRVYEERSSEIRSRLRELGVDYK